MAPHSTGELVLAFVGVDGNHRGGAGQGRRHHGGQPDGAEPEDGHRLAGGDRRGIQHGPHSGEHGAAEHGRNGVRDVVADHHDGFPGHHGIVREGRDPEVVVDPLPRRRPQQRLAVQEVA